MVSCSLHWLQEEAAEAVREAPDKPLRTFGHTTAYTVHLASPPDVAAEIRGHVVETLLDLTEKAQRGCCQLCRPQRS